MRPATGSIQESYNTPRYRTPVRQSPYPTMKGFPLQPIGKGLGVCSSSVCWNNLRKYGSSEQLPGQKGKNYMDSLKWSSFEHGDARNFMKIMNMSHYTSELLVESKVLQENSSLNIGNILNSSSQTPLFQLSFEAHHVWYVKFPKMQKNSWKWTAGSRPSATQKKTAWLVWLTSWTKRELSTEIIPKIRCEPWGLEYVFPRFTRNWSRIHKLMVNYR